MPPAVPSKTVSPTSPGLTENHHTDHHLRCDRVSQVLSFHTDEGAPAVRVCKRALAAEFFEQAHEVIGVFFLHRQNGFHHPACRRVIISQVVNHLAVAVDGDALGYQVFLDHVDQRSLPS